MLARRHVVAALAGIVLLGACTNSKVTAVNLPPLANAGFDQVVAPGDTVTLDGRASRDPDGMAGAELTFEWTGIAVPTGSAAVLAGTESARPTFVADVRGAYLFLLRVRDAAGAESLPDVVAVSVVPFLTIAAVVPADATLGAPTTTTIAVIFSEPVQPESANAGDILLTSAAGVVSAAVSLDEGNRVAVLTPSVPLAPGTTYTVYVGVRVKNLWGQSLALPYRSMFTTATGPDTGRPQVIAVAPAASATGVATSAAVTVTFSEPVLATTLSTATFTLTRGGPVAGTVMPSAGGLRATFTPSVALSLGVSYDIALSQSVQDLAGNALLPFTSSFSTTNVADTTRPTVTFASPGNGYTGVAPATAIVLTFSEPMDPATFTASSLTLVPQGGTAVSAAVVAGADHTYVTLTPTSLLAFATVYDLRLTTAARDLAGNPLDGDGAGGDFVSHFVTMPELVDLDHFAVEAAPLNLVVGQATKVTITAKTLAGDTMLDYQNVLPVLLAHSGTAARSRWSGVGVSTHVDFTAELATSAFDHGVASVLLTDYQPEGPISISATEQDSSLFRTGTTTASGANVTWTLGPVSRLRVAAAPTSLTAGDPTTVTISATDAYDNLVGSYQSTQVVALSHNGTTARTTWSGASVTDLGAGAGSLAAGAFVGGRATLVLTDLAAEGPITVTATNAIEGLAGSTTDSGTNVTWRTGALVSFSVTASATSPGIGQPVTITVVARDQSGNVITDYQNAATLRLEHNGTAGLVAFGGAGASDYANGTGALQSAAFANGVATFTITASGVAPGVTVTVTEQDSGQNRFGSTAASSSNISWAAGALDHFSVDLSNGSPVAGQTVVVTIRARDASNNIASYSGTLTLAHQTGATSGKAWSNNACLVTLGADASGNNSLSSGCWTAGATTVDFTNSRAEGPLQIVVSDGAGHTGASVNVTWASGSVVNFAVTAAPTSRVVGETAAVTIVARDVNGNTVTGYQNTAAITLTHSGTPATALFAGVGVGDLGNGTATLASGNFAGGAASITLTDTGADANVAVTVTEHDTGLNRFGSSVASGTNVTWVVGGLHHFWIGTSVANPTAGIPLTLTIEARDQNNNKITSYVNSAPLTLQQTGVSCATCKTWSGNTCLVSSPSDAGGNNTLTSGCSSWSGGQLLVDFTNDKAEGPLVITVNDSSGNSGATANITWKAGPLVFFLVSAAPTSPTVGGSTVVTITAVDAFYNPIATYANVNPMTLGHNGTQASTIWSGAGVTDNGDRTASLAAGHFVGGVASATLTDSAADVGVIVTATENDVGCPGSCLHRSGTTNPATNITWKAGGLDHFLVSANASSPTAGQTITITVTAKDVSNATITTYDNLLPLALEHQGGVVDGKTWSNNACLVTPAAGGPGADASGNNTLAAGCWSSGVLTVQFTDTVAEGPLQIVVIDPDTGKTGSSGSVTFVPGPLARFTVAARAPWSIVAGAAATVDITAEDVNGNVLPAYQNVAVLRLLQNAGTTGFTWGGCATPAALGAATLAGTCFAGGVATVTLADSQAEGPVEVKAVEDDTVNHFSGDTSITATNVTWTAAAMHHFRVEASPISLPVTAASTLTLTAQDQYDNAIASYDPATSIVVTPTGASGTLTYMLDGAPQTGPTATIPAHTLFNAIGAKSLTVADSAASAGVMFSVAQATTTFVGDTSQTATNVTWVASGGCSPPVAKPLQTPQASPNRCVIALDGSTSTNGGNPPLTYAWSFVPPLPAGSALTSGSFVPNSAVASPSFTVDVPGNYIVKLVVTNACGGVHNDIVVATYDPKPRAGEVLINEVVTQPRTDWDLSGGLSARRDQFIEFYNRTACTVDITGTAVTFGGTTVATYVFGGTIGARQFMWPTGSTSLISAFKANDYLALQNPGDARTVPNVVWVQLLTAVGGTAIDGVELGNNPRGDALGNCAPAGAAAGGANTGVADECVARHPNATDTNIDNADFRLQACTRTGGAASWANP